MKFEPTSYFTILLSLCLMVLVAPYSYAGSAQAFSLKPDEELDLTFAASLQGHAHLRVSNDFLCVEIPEHHMIIVAEAPTWSVRAISPPRKLTGVSSFEDWVRRGSPLNFLKVTSIPEWPLIRLGSKPFMQWQATAYALPYKTQQGKAVPLNRGRVGDFLVLGEGILPAPACQIVATLIQTPKVNGLPVQLNLWDTEQSSKINSVFLFSGGKDTGPKELEATKLTIVKKRSLPSIRGYKTCRDPREVWFSHADTEGFEGLLH
jgi:hypothetical protein